MVVLHLHEELVEDVVSEVRTGGSVVLTGLPGSGRSAVLRRSGDLLADAGYEVLRVRGVRALRDKALEALAVSDLAADRPARGASLLATYVAALGQLASGRRLVVVVDDADDLDDSSVGALVAAWGVRPFAVIAAIRPRVAPAGDHDLTASLAPVVRLFVPPLTYEETTRLVEAVLGGPVDATTAGRMHAKSGGMPGFGAAIARAARRTGHLAQVEGTWKARADLWTPALGETVEHLFTGLSADKLDGLRVLALTGPVTPATAADLITWEVLESLDDHRLLRTVRHGEQELVALYPPILAEQFRRAGREAATTRLSQRIVRVLGDGATPDPHLLAGLDDVRRRRAADRVCTPGGREDAAVLNRTVAEHVHRQRVLRAAEWERDPTPSTAAAYLETLLTAGGDDHLAAARVVERTPERGDPTAVGVLRMIDATRLAVSGDLPAAHRVLSRPLPVEVVAADPGLPHALEAQGRRLTLALERVPDAGPTGVGAPAPEAGGPLATDLIRLERVESLLARGRASDARALLDGWQPRVEALRRPRDVAEGVALLFDGRPADALDWSSHHLTEATVEDDVGGVWAHGYVRGLALSTLGRWDDLRDHLGAVLSVGMIPVGQTQLAVGSLVLGAYVALRQGRPDAAETLARQAQGLSAAPGPWPLMSVGWFDAVAAATAVADTQAQADAFWAEAERLAERGYAMAAAVVGQFSVESVPDRDRSEQIAAMLADARGGGAQDLTRLVLAITAADPEPALELYRDSSRRGVGLVATRSLWHAVRGLRARGEGVRADELLAEAFGAGLLPPEMLDSLEGVDVLADLTAREREVSRLVEAGLSNQQIAHRLLISVSTVENHLNRVYRKVGVAGRDELVARLAAVTRP